MEKPSFGKCSEKTQLSEELLYIEIDGKVHKIRSGRGPLPKDFQEAAAKANLDHLRKPDLIEVIKEGRLENAKLVSTLPTYTDGQHHYIITIGQRPKDGVIYVYGEVSIPSHSLNLKGPAKHLSGLIDKVAGNQIEGCSIKKVERFTDDEWKKKGYYFLHKRLGMTDNEKPA